MVPFSPFLGHDVNFLQGYIYIQFIFSGLVYLQFFGFYAL